MKKRLAILAVALVGAFAIGVADASAVTRWVNDTGPYTPPGTSCSMPGYATIQSAVNSAIVGDTINVCPGTYPEQVSVETAAKNSITIRSVVPLAARIQAPPVMEIVHGRPEYGSTWVHGTLPSAVSPSPAPSPTRCFVPPSSGQAYG